MDYAAATPVDSRVQATMTRFFKDIFGNPSATHTHGRQAAEKRDEFRRRVANVFAARPREVVFTSGATESNTLAVAGCLRWLQKTNGSLDDCHVVCSSIEHSSVIAVVKRFAREHNLSVDFVSPNKDGIVTADRITSAIQPNTVLVSIMYVNGEIGTVQPVSSISSRIQTLQNQGTFDTHESVVLPIFHTDATQAPLFRSISTQRLQADLISIDAQKIYGPKGSGALYVSSDVELQPVFVGGGQEFGLRSGTENLPLIAGLTHALEIAKENRDAFVERMSALQDAFITRLKTLESDVRINGSLDTRIENNVSVSFPGRNHTFLATKLDNHGISAGTKSACLEGGDEGSPVISEISDDASTDGALRFTFGKGTTMDHIEYTADILKGLDTN